MTDVDPRSRAVAAGTLMFARTVYAFNWYNIGGVLPLIGTRFGIGTVEFGILLVAFLVGAAIFQIPAGFAAMRWGSRATSVAALAVMAACACASAVSPNWIVLAAFRFGTGAGAAFFFAPALGLVTAYFPSGQRGVVIGAYNAGFSLGSGVGVIVSAVLGELYGWAVPLALGGALLVIATGLAWVLLPRPSTEGMGRNFGEVARAARPVLRSRTLWAVGLAGIGLWGGFYIAAQYFVAFARDVHPTWSLALAAAAPTLMIFLEIPGAPIGGWFGERARDMRRTLALWGLASGALLAAVPFLPFDLIVPAFVLLGFACGLTFALLYLLPTYLPEVRGDAMALGLALVNSVQIFGGSAMAIAFAVLAAGVGYEGAWIFAGVATAAFLPALALASAPGRSRGARAGDEGAPTPPALPSGRLG